MIEKYKQYIMGVWSILMIGSLHIILFDNNEKYDVYLFYNHERYFTNILYDFSVMYNFSILTYFLMRLDKKIFRPLFIFSLLQWLSYFLFYRQMWTLLTLPCVAVFYYYEFENELKKWKNKSQ